MKQVTQIHNNKNNRNLRLICNNSVDKKLRNRNIFNVSYQRMLRPESI